jgi:DNA repair protein RecN (Recombination protein N)
VGVDHAGAGAACARGGAIEAAEAGEQALVEVADAIVARLGALASRLAALASHDAALGDIVALIEPARIQLDEAARELRSYRQKLDVDPAELARIDERIAAIHGVARKHRVRPEQLPQLLADTQAEIAALAEASDFDALARRADAAQKTFAAIAGELSAKREFAASELANRVSAAMQQLAMTGGRFEVALLPLDEPASFGAEQVVFEVATHPKQPLAPLARVASGG